MNRVALTTFSPEGYHVYGRSFIETFIRYWPIPLVCFVQGEAPSWKPDGVTYIDLEADPEYRAFIKDHEDNPVAHGFRHGRIDYRYQAVKFSHKVFAQTSPERPPCDQWIWIDADVDTVRKIDNRFFEEACPPDVIASHLGRKDWHHTECGFMAYNIPKADPFLRRFREIYLTGEVFALPEWHDSFVWDVVRKEVGGEFRNLSQEISGIHVWPFTILGQYMFHAKGPDRKITAYGRAI